MSEGTLETPQVIVRSFLKRAKLARLGVYLVTAEATPRGASVALVTNVDDPVAADGMRLFLLGLAQPGLLDACAKAVYEHSVALMRAHVDAAGGKSDEAPPWDELPVGMKQMHTGLVLTVFETLKDQSVARLPRQVVTE